MFAKVWSFGRDQDGAVTVDFVVVTAAVVGLGMATVITLADHILDLSVPVAQSFETEISAQTYSGQTD